MSSHSDTNKENQRQLDTWDPESSKKEGTMRAWIEYKSDVPEASDMQVEFDEPVLKENKSSKAKVVNTVKRNKRGLF